MDKINVQNQIFRDSFGKNKKIEMQGNHYIHEYHGANVWAAWKWNIYTINKHGHYVDRITPTCLPTHFQLSQNLLSTHFHIFNSQFIREHFECKFVVVFWSHICLWIIGLDFDMISSHTTSYMVRNRYPHGSESLWIIVWIYRKLHRKRASVYRFVHPQYKMSLALEL